MPRTTPVVGAVDLGGVPTWTADTVATDAAQYARPAGVDPSILFVATHRVVGRDGVHTAVTISGSGIAEWQVWRMCNALARRHVVRGCTVGRHSLGDADAQAVTQAAIQERLSRIGGRCVLYPGVEAVNGTMTVGQIVATTAIEVVGEIGGDPLGPDVPVRTGGHLRPRWEFGALTLHVQEAEGDVYLPFEVGPVVNR